MRETIAPEWRFIKSLDDLDKLIEVSVQSPVIVFRYNSDRKEDYKLKKSLDLEWEITEPIPTYLLDDCLVPDIPPSLCEQLDIEDSSPIILLVIEGEVIYEECDEITAKKIQLATKIVKRTFKWMELRKQKKAPGKPKA